MATRLLRGAVWNRGKLMWLFVAPRARVRVCCCSLLQLCRRLLPPRAVVFALLVVVVCTVASFCSRVPLLLRCVACRCCCRCLPLRAVVFVELVVPRSSLSARLGTRRDGREYYHFFLTVPHLNFHFVYYRAQTFTSRGFHRAWCRHHRAAILHCSGVLASTKPDCDFLSRFISLDLTEMRLKTKR